MFKQNSYESLAVVSAIGSEKKQRLGCHAADVEPRDEPRSYTPVGYLQNASRALEDALAGCYVSYY